MIDSVLVQPRNRLVPLTNLLNKTGNPILTFEAGPKICVKQPDQET